MSKLLVLLLGGVILFNLNGGIENEQTISEGEGRRIARELGWKLIGIGCYKLENGRTPTKDRTITRVLQKKVARASNLGKQNERNNPQFLQRSPKVKRVSKRLVYHYADKGGLMRIGLWKMVLAESGGNIYARSPNGTYLGLMQWNREHYNGQARAYGYKHPNIFNARQHLEVSCRAISEQQEWRWPNTKHFLTDYYADI